MYFQSNPVRKRKTNSFRSSAAYHHPVVRTVADEYLEFLVGWEVVGVLREVEKVEVEKAMILFYRP